jgi:aconitate hydratase
MIIPPLAPDLARQVEIIRGPNIKPLSVKEPLTSKLSGQVLIKVPDNITTDHIIPGGAKVSTLRYNIPAISEYTFERVDPSFVKRAKELKGFVVANNYGQGSVENTLQSVRCSWVSGRDREVLLGYLANLINFEFCRSPSR